VRLLTKPLLALIVILGLASQAEASEIVVAAASDLSTAIKDIVAAFQKSSGHTVRLTVGSSGNFYAQIRNGAPFDVFLSADLHYVRELEKAGLAESGTSYTYATGHLVLWVPRNSTIPIENQGMKALLDPRVKRIAIANPEFAPYGRAAVEAMKRAGVYESVKSKFVLGENVAQTAQFAQSAAADIGIIGLSLALSEPLKSQGKFWKIPIDSYPRMEQAAVVLKQAAKAGRRETAQAFMNLLRSERGRAILRGYGFEVK
jgi:molybdate transport system substrate-binding protein